jgi:hypothetical protein
MKLSEIMLIGLIELFKIFVPVLGLFILFLAPVLLVRHYRNSWFCAGYIPIFLITIYGLGKDPL